MKSLLNITESLYRLGCALGILVFFISAEVAYTEDTSSSNLKSIFSLTDCINIAIESSPSLKVVRESVKLSKERVNEARARFFPALSIAGNAQKTDDQRLPTFNGETFGSDLDWGAEVELKQELFSGGRNYSLFKQQTLLHETAKYEYEAALNDLIFRIKQDYFNIILSQQQLIAEEENVVLLEKHLDNERKKRDVGSSSDFNVLRSEVSLANSRTPMIRSREAVKLAVESLIKDMGADFGSDPLLIKTFSGKLEYIPSNYILEDSLVEARNNRPEIQRLLLLVNAKERAISVEFADKLPQISVYGSYGVDKSPFSSSSREEDHGWKAGVRGSWNIFDGLRVESKINQARIEKDISSLNLEDLLLTVAFDVRTAYARLLEAVELVKASNQTVNQAKESLRLAEVRFNTGIGIQLDVLSAQLSLLEAKTNYLKALFDHMVSVANMERAIGKRG